MLAHDFPITIDDAKKAAKLTVNSLINWMRGEHKNAVLHGHPELWDNPTNRNISSAAWIETFWADALNSLGYITHRDGRPGKFDVIQKLSSEENVGWEIKLTSPKSNLGESHTLKFCCETTAVEHYDKKIPHLLVGIKYVNEKYYAFAGMTLIDKSDFKTNNNVYRRLEIDSNSLRNKTIPLIGEILTTYTQRLENDMNSLGLNYNDLASKSLEELIPKVTTHMQKKTLTKSIVRRVENTINLMNKENLLMPRINVLKYKFLDVDDI